MQVGVDDINKRISPKEFMQTRLQLKDLSNDSPLNINGNEAHTGLSTVNTGSGKRTARFTVIYFNDRAYIIAGVARDINNASRYDQEFLTTAQSFHAMTSKERQAAQPLRLKVIQADAGTRFGDLARSSPLETYPEEQLRLLNALFPQGEIQPGMVLKTVE